MRLIDANSFKAQLIYLANHMQDNGHSTYAAAVGEIISILDRRQTIDAVPVVRCKDCQYAIPLDGHAFRRWGNNALNCTECRGDDGFGMAGVSLAYHDGFCDMGVRRECEPHD